MTNIIQQERADPALQQSRETLISPSTDLALRSGTSHFAELMSQFKASRMVSINA